MLRERSNIMRSSSGEGGSHPKEYQFVCSNLRQMLSKNYVILLGVIKRSYYWITGERGWGGQDGPKKI